MLITNANQQIKLTDCVCVVLLLQLLRCIDGGAILWLLTDSAMAMVRIDDSADRERQEQQLGRNF